MIYNQFPPPRPAGASALDGPPSGGTERAGPHTFLVSRLHDSKMRWCSPRAHRAENFSREGACVAPASPLSCAWNTFSGQKKGARLNQVISVLKPEASRVVLPGRRGSKGTTITLSEGMLVDTRGDGKLDAKLVDSNGDGRPDKIVYLNIPDLLRQDPRRLEEASRNSLRRGSRRIGPSLRSSGCPSEQQVHVVWHSQHHAPREQRQKLQPQC